MKRLIGLGVSPGVAVGPAFILRQRALDARFRIPDEAIEGELFRLARARAHTARQLHEIKAKVAEAAGGDHAYLFDAQLLMLEDPMLMERAAALINTERLNAEWALQRASDELGMLLRQGEDTYLRERHGDIADVVSRLRVNLRGGRNTPADFIAGAGSGLILVADDLPPSVAAQIDWHHVMAFAIDAGSWTHHTAILARSLHVPAVVSLHDASIQIQPGATIALDGFTGEVLVDPAEDMLSEMRARIEPAPRPRRRTTRAVQEPVVTQDGATIHLFANIERIDDPAHLRDTGAEGIGLFRTEFLLVGRRPEDLAEDSQATVYGNLLAAVAPFEVTIRTFDTTETAADDPRSELRSETMGLRGVRLSLARPAAFRTQIRALLRAAPSGTLRILLPFVSRVEQVREARRHVAEITAELKQQGTAVPDVPVGVMLEVPSAMLTADLLAREADFFSIGTNDLIQYGLAVDRIDDRIAHLYEPLHPAILRLILGVVRQAKRRHVRVAVCGEMASDPVALAILAGLGVTEFSMTPLAIAQAACALRRIRVTEARSLAARALKMATGTEIRALAEQVFGRKSPDGDLKESQVTRGE